MKRLFLFYIVTIICLTTRGQELKVTEAFQPVFEIIKADDMIYDSNGIPCALVKVQLPIPDVLFEGNLVDVKYKVNEHWCYLTQGTKMFRIKCVGCQPFDVKITDVEPEGLSPKKCYTIRLELPEQIVTEMSANKVNPEYGKYVLDKLEEGNRLYEEKDYKNAAKCFEIAAEAGHPEGQLYYGHCFIYGHGVKKNHAKGEMWMKKAAEQGFVLAQTVLSNYYCEGYDGFEQNQEEGMKWIKKAADQGDAFAQCEIGFKYEYGRGVEQDIYQAAEWYKKAADQGYERAQANMGKLCAKGVHVKLSEAYQEALKWYMKAAESGKPEYQFRLGEYLAKNKKDEEAIPWYIKAAEQNYKDAQIELGKCYENGIGVIKDYDEAIRWYQKAAAHKYSMGENYLKSLQKKMKEEQ